MNNKEVLESIIYQDTSFLIANKPSGVSAQNDLSKDDSFHKMLQRFSSLKLFLIHRLDRPTSGVMVFAKKKKAATYFSELDENQIEKIYYAAVKTAPEKAEDEIIHYLEHDSKQRKSLVSTVDNPKAKEAKLKYKIIGKIENYTLLEVTLKSGRFHQIRAQLAAIGSPIKGDVKYGARRANKDRSINLHASSITFPLMYTEEMIRLSAKTEDDPVWKAFTDSNVIMSENKYDKWKVKK